MEQVATGLAHKLKSSLQPAAASVTQRKEASKVKATPKLKKEP
jgi:hypothetical protein